MNQSVTWNLFKAREKSRVQGAIGLGFACHGLKIWRDIFLANPYAQQDRKSVV